MIFRRNQKIARMARTCRHFQRRKQTWLQQGIATMQMPVRFIENLAAIQESLRTNVTFKDSSIIGQENGGNVGRIALTRRLLNKLPDRAALNQIFNYLMWAVARIVQIDAVSALIPAGQRKNVNWVIFSAKWGFSLSS